MIFLPYEPAPAGDDQLQSPAGAGSETKLLRCPKNEQFSASIYDVCMDSRLRGSDASLMRCYPAMPVPVQTG